MMLDHLITQSFFTVGRQVFQQVIGIPMGIDPAPFWANLYLYYFEETFMTKLSKNKTERYKGFKFKHVFRFIDDACCLNDNEEFEKRYKEIYPDVLRLKCEHRGNHATFYDLDITIQNGIFVYKLFDKRDNFPFSIVRMPDLSGNIPEHIFYGSIYSELLRIARASLRYSDFLSKSRQLKNRMLKQGASIPKLVKTIDKIFLKNQNTFFSFNTNPSEIKRDLLKH